MFDKLKESFRKRAERNRAHRDLLRAISDHDIAGVKELSAARDLINLNSYPYLAHAVNEGTPKIIATMLKNGADQNLWTRGTVTRLIVPPIAEAILQRKPEMVAVFLDDPRVIAPDEVHVWRDADDLLTPSSETLLGLARNRGSRECLELLEKHMMEKYKRKYESDDRPAPKKPSEPGR
ncbi:MAG: hypothetical protein HND56_11810 [Pseudomonadota bacterium]|nr:hypothetical protein [Pseudomonadota bacterium]QKK06328.1 MAG: hypothetical protein HND56_11810 [Pseudomonadota bacterium]